jgi:hypothetical protein
VTEDLDRQVVATALNDMARKGTFYVSDFNKCAKILGVVVPKDVQQKLDALHCVSFSAMPEAVQVFVQQVCMDLFSMPGFSLTPAKNVLQLTQPRKRRLLGGI